MSHKSLPVLAMLAFIDGYGVCCRFVRLFVLLSWKVVVRLLLQVCILDQKDVMLVPLVSELKLIGRRGEQAYQLLR